MTAAIMITATSVNIVFLNKVGPRPLMVLGMVLGAVVDGRGSRRSPRRRATPATSSRRWS